MTTDTKFIGRAGRTREKINSPQRKVEITASVENCEDYRNFARMVRHALKELWEAEDSADQEKSEKGTWIGYGGAGSNHDFTASNGIRIRACFPTIKD